MAEQDEVKFRRLIVPHFEAAYNLARWLTGDPADAADVLQDSSLKALRFIKSMVSENSRAWFLQIVRNTSYTLLKNKKVFDEFDLENELKDPSLNSEDLLVENATAKELYEALNELPVISREILILREIEEASYDDIAEILQIPIGTVMSRLARARALLKKILCLKGERT